MLRAMGTYWASVRESIARDWLVRSHATLCA